MIKIQFNGREQFWIDAQVELRKLLVESEQLQSVCALLKQRALQDARMCSLTADNRQFRVWNQVPVYVGKTHVDGFDPYGTLCVSGDEAAVKLYRNVIVEALGFTGVMLPNGSSVYLNMNFI